ncbi:hypothetical protein LIER_15645 [Lithospermum erythrorhizon]|uniref:Uncharacterized protein n=1 Tax=Lithospermum erythrorhizon TaxID=34254 RepID=A0AAV3Q8B6_LITER
MCSSGSVFPMNLVNAGSFNPTGMMALRMLGEKGASPSNYVLVPHRAYGATLSERASTCYSKATITSGEDPGPLHL